MYNELTIAILYVCRIVYRNRIVNSAELCGDNKINHSLNVQILFIACDNEYRLEIELLHSA